MAKHNKPPRRTRNRRNQWPNIPQGRAFMDYALNEIAEGRDPGEGQPLLWFKSKHSDEIAVCNVPQAWLWFVLDNLRGIGSHRGERLEFGIRTFCPQRMKQVDVLWPWLQAKAGLTELNRIFADNNPADIDDIGLIEVQSKFIIHSIVTLFDAVGFEEY